MTKFVNKLPQIKMLKICGFGKSLHSNSETDEYILTRLIIKKQIMFAIVADAQRSGENLKKKWRYRTLRLQRS